VTRDWIRAAEQGDVGAFAAILDQGASIDQCDQFGRTALMIAAHNGRSELVAYLIAKGADLNARAKYGLTPLMLAVIARDVESVYTLVRAGADLRVLARGVPGFAGRTAYDLAMDYGLTELRDDLRPR
jgi:uncharacterized protein